MNSVEQSRVIDFVKDLIEVRLPPQRNHGTLSQQTYDKIMKMIYEGLARDQSVIEIGEAGSLSRLAYDSIRQQLDQGRVTSFIERFTEELGGARVLLERTAGSLKQLAYDKMVDEMTRLGNKYDELRCVEGESLNKLRLVVILNNRDVYLMSRRPYEEMLTDFPRFNDPSLSPINSQGTYYRLDGVETGDSQRQNTYVAAGVGPPGMLGGKKMQTINLIYPCGTFTYNIMSFCVAFD